MTNYIWITTQKEMLHHYPDAPKEVEYLRNPHRHIFHFKFYLEIKGDNREVEFIMFKQYVEKILKEHNIGTMSCEMIANYLQHIVAMEYPDRKMKIEVSEDSENGVLMEYGRVDT